MIDELESNENIIFSNKNSYNFENSTTVNNIKDLKKLASQIPDKLICLFFWASCWKNCFAFVPLFEKVREEFNEEIIFYYYYLKRILLKFKYEYKQSLLNCRNLLNIQGGKCYELFTDDLDFN
ncbi:hypothetical protein ES705_25294 [subsurface metagenome]